MSDVKETQELKEKADDLKHRIDEMRRKVDMPVNSSLGSPKIDAENADGRRDVKDEHDQDDD